MAARGLAITPAGGHVVRGEMHGAPVKPAAAIAAYKDLTAADFAGTDDLRLKQIGRVAGQENGAMVQEMKAALARRGITDVDVYGRAKSPQSMFGKLVETDGMSVGQIKDLSGLRIDTHQAGVDEIQRVRGAVTETFGDALTPKKDYVVHPNPPEKGGYAGRVHDLVDGTAVPEHELQVGHKDSSGFIDGKVKNASGEARSLHDLTGFKGELYGVKVPPELQGEYMALMKDISRNNATGKTLAESPELAARVAKFRSEVQAQLPAKFAAPPEPELAGAARLRNAAARGLGVVGVAGGGLQYYNGLEELQAGKTAEGVSDVGGGVTNMAAGGAMIAGRVALGTTLGGVAATGDGIKDIYVGVRDGDVERGVVGGVKTAAGGAMIAGVATANPILIAGGAVTYGGAVVYENREAIADGAVWVGDKAIVAGTAVKDTAVAAGSAVKGAAVNSARWVGDRATAATDAVGGALSSAGGRVKSLFTGW